MQVLQDGLPVTDVTPGGQPAHVPEFALTAAQYMSVQGLPGPWLQWRDEGVDVGDANVAIVDLVGDPSNVTATRGVGENRHVITVRLSPGPFDPLWDHVVLLIQNGELADKSQYARTLTALGGTSEDQVVAGFPSGKSLLVAGNPPSVGLTWAFDVLTTPELVYASDAVCIETFYRTNDGAVGLQTLYGDEHGLRSSGILFAVNDGDGLVRSEMNTLVGPGGFASQPQFGHGLIKHLAWQKTGTTCKLYLDGIGYTITGTTVPVSILDPVSPVTLPPSIGRMTGYGGTNNFNFDGYRITTVTPRYTTNFTPPTELFPER